MAWSVPRWWEPACLVEIHGGGPAKPPCRVELRRGSQKDGIPETLFRKIVDVGKTQFLAPAAEDVAPGVRADAMKRVNPAFIPRNHRIEELIAAAVIRSDFEPFETLLRVLERPYEEQSAYAHLSEPPLPEQRVTATFCGT